MKNVKLAFSKPTADPEEQRLLFSRFREAGYDGLQLKAGQYQRYLRNPDGFLEEWGSEPGAASALIAGGRLDPEGSAALRDLIAFARAVGSERIVFCHGVPREGRTPEEIREYARILSDLGEEALTSGVRLSLHHHYNQPVMHREDFDVFFGAAKEGAVGLTVDTAHLVKSGVTDIAELLRSFRSVVDNLHLKDIAEGEFRVLGHGEIDFAPVFAALREIRYEGWLCADEESGADLLGAMGSCHRYITSRLDERQGEAHGDETRR
ncbi:MAG: sugar phosphate isomerase/epimerase [Armatimonadetes bacterium]|nr:sugar phosphate isomerase/epimerase [Armatimonadota bacterium]